MARIVLLRSPMDRTVFLQEGTYVLTILRTSSSDCVTVWDKSGTSQLVSMVMPAGDRTITPHSLGSGAVVALTVSRPVELEHASA